MNNQKIKVLHVVTALSWRGGEQQVAYLLQELKDNVKAYVLCSSNSEMEKFCRKHEIECFPQKKKGSIDLAYARKIKRICVVHGIDCCHLHDAHAHTYAVIAAAFFGNKTKLVLSRRVDFPIKSNWFSSYKYNHPAISRILCVSDTIRKITAHGIRNKAVLYTVYSGIDLNKFGKNTGKLRKELGVSRGTFLIGNTSALADHKDYFTFLDVSEKIISNNEDVHIVIMGAGPMEKEIKQYAASKKLKGKLSFTGFRTDVPEVLSELNLFLITSKTEGLGTSILDAFACKIPVVATNGGGISELVENRKTGLLCEVKNVSQITDAVEECIKDNELREKLTEEAFEKVQLFSKSRTAKKTLEHYHSIST